jgi:hypothetical protein
MVCIAVEIQTLALQQACSVAVFRIACKMVTYSVKQVSLEREQENPIRRKSQ